MNDINNTYEILKSVFVTSGDTSYLNTINNTYEVFQAVYDDSLDALRITAQQPSLDVFSTEPFQATFLSADTYHQFSSTGSSTTNVVDFVYVPTAGTMTYIGSVNNKRIVFIGSSDISVDTISTQVTYALFKNEDLITETPTDFTALDRIKNISKNRIINLDYGDVLSVRAKCANAGVTATVQTLQLTFFGL